MQIRALIPGVKIVGNDKRSLLFGCPPEIIKHLMLGGIPFPEYIVLPDTLYHEGVLQNCTEFPLYYYLFVLGNFSKGRRLNIVGEEEQIRANRELLRLTLLGPTLEEYAELGDSPNFQELYREARSLAMKDKEGNELSIDQLVNFIAFHEHRVELDDCTLVHKDRNVYEIDRCTIDINFTESQVPPYTLHTNYVPALPTRFGVDVLGGGSGFTPGGPCSGLLLNYNSDYMLIDCVPYLDFSLNARGVSLRQIKALFLSHIHDDHCNIFPLVLSNNKIKFLGTKEIFWMAMKKLALQTLTGIDQFYSYFDFIELTPYAVNEFYGLTIVPHYTVHSIPTIGAVFGMKGPAREHTIVFIGDNKALADIRTMAERGLVSTAKQQYIEELYRKPWDLLFPDGGMGILHGNPRDALESKADRIVFQHLEDLPSEFDTTFSLSRAGKRYSILDSAFYTYMIRTVTILQENFPGMSRDWVNTLMNQFVVVAYNLDDVIMKQGEESKGMIYIILSGKCAVQFHDGVALRLLAVKEAGDFIGDMAVVQGVRRRSASIVAHTPVTLCGIDERLFYSFLKAENRIGKIKAMWGVRQELGSNYPFSGFSDFVNEKLARVSKRLVIAAGSEVVKQGGRESEFYIVLKGRFRVLHDGREVNILAGGDMFGEYASLAGTARNATISALEEAVVLEIRKEAVTQIVDSTPILHFYLNQLMKRRKEELALITPG